MTEEKKFFKLLEKINIRLTRHDDPEFVTDAARRGGATHCWTILNDVDFNFNQKGELVGVNTGSLRSFRGRR